MPEHRIRLRGGWVCKGAGEPASSEYRLALPHRWKPEDSGRFVLSRVFQRPPVDPDREAVHLCMENVPGIRALSLNGSPIASIRVERPVLEVELGDLRPRNVLVIEFEPVEQTGPTANGSDEWGHIALVIRPRQTD